MKYLKAIVGIIFLAIPLFVLALGGLSMLGGLMLWIAITICGPYAACGNNLWGLLEVCGALLAIFGPFISIAFICSSHK